MNNYGKVYLIGAGPGDPGLITVKGLAGLRQAEVVLYDRLVHPQLLAEAPTTAELIDLSKEEIAAADESLRLSKERFQNGAALTLEVIAAEEALYSAKSRAAHFRWALHRRAESRAARAGCLGCRASGKCNGPERSTASRDR